MFTRYIVKPWPYSDYWRKAWGIWDRLLCEWHETNVDRHWAREQIVHLNREQSSV